jgi:hypothetical protein
VQLVGDERQERFRQAPTLEQVLRSKFRPGPRVSIGSLYHCRLVSDEQLTGALSKQTVAAESRYHADVKGRRLPPAQDFRALRMVNLPMS